MSETKPQDEHLHPGPPGRKQWIQSALLRFEAPLLAYAKRVTGDIDAARDVVQDVFLKLCRTDPQELPELEERLGPWLFSVCRNRAIDERRRNTRTGNVNNGSQAQALDTKSPDPGPAEQVEGTETLSRVSSAMQNLPEKQREVLLLKFQNGLSYKEIAGITELSVGNVGYLIHMGVRSLREKLQGQLGAGIPGGLTGNATPTSLGGSV